MIKGKFVVRQKTLRRRIIESELLFYIVLLLKHALSKVSFGLYSYEAEKPRKQDSIQSAGFRGKAKALETLFEETGYTADKRISLSTALTHPGADLSGGGGYQRLEFLGDSVFGMAAAMMLYKALPGEREGRMTKEREALVSGKALAEAGFGLGLSGLIRTRPGHEYLSSKDWIVADVMEAIVGAIAVDMGEMAALNFASLVLDRQKRANIRQGKKGAA